MKRHFMLYIVVLAIALSTMTISHARTDIESFTYLISNPNEESIDTEQRNQDFIDGLTEAGNLASANVEGAEKVTDGVKYIAAWIFQVASYTLMCLLAIRVLLDLVYIGIPFSRVFLNKGTGANQSDQYGAEGLRAGMMNSPGGMNQGMNRTTGNEQSRVQWVSNAALNAVANEGTGTSPFKVYIKDMAVMLVLVPVLITLAATGALTSLGLVIGEIMVEAIQSLNNLI